MRSWRLAALGLVAVMMTAACGLRAPGQDVRAARRAALGTGSAPGAGSSSVTDASSVGGTGVGAGDATTPGAAGASAASSGGAVAGGAGAANTPSAAGGNTVAAAPGPPRRHCGGPRHAGPAPSHTPGDN